MPPVPLTDPLWTQLAPRSPELVPTLLTRLYDDPTDADWAELAEQCCHQMTLSAVAYAALPHAFAVAQKHELLTSQNFIGLAARCAAPAAIDGQVPAEVRDSFLRILPHVGPFALAAARTTRSPDDHAYALANAAVLNGRATIGASLFLILHNAEAELHCPSCDLYLLAGELDSEAPFVQSVSPKMEPMSAASLISRREVRKMQPTKAPISDFDWLLSIVREAGQTWEQPILAAVYGEARCPACKTKFGVADEILRAFPIAQP